jgi:hypothetical protein
MIEPSCSPFAEGDNSNGDSQNGAWVYGASASQSVSPSKTEMPFCLSTV